MKNLPLTVPTSAFDRPLSRWVAAALLALAGTVATVLLSRSMPAGAPASSAAAAPMASAAPTAPVVTTDPVEAVYKSVEEHSPTF